MADFRLGFETATREVAEALCERQGDVPPSWLRGRLLHNGPGLFDVGGHKYRHAFDGLSLLHGFEITPEGQVVYSSRYLQSPDYTDTMERGEPAYTEFATVPERGFLERLKAELSPASQFGLNNSINVISRGARVLALGDVPTPIEVDPATLETLGQVHEEGDGHLLLLRTAHPLFDPATDEWVNVGLGVGVLGIGYVVYRQFGDSNDREPLAFVPRLRPTYMHSFALSPRYVVLTEHPWLASLVEVASMGLTSRPLVECFEWDPGAKTTFFVIERATGDLAGTFHSDPMFVLHHINAFEVDDKLVVDVAAYEDASIIDDMYLDRLRGPDGAAISRCAPRRFEFDLKAGTLSSRELSNEMVELPRIAPEYALKDYRFVYGNGARLGGAPDYVNQLTKLDVRTGRTWLWHSTGCYPMEGVPVRRPGAKAEDDGVLLVIVLDARNDNAFLLILDLATFAERARFVVPVAIPFGFHGTFLPAPAKHIPPREPTLDKKRIAILGGGPAALSAAFHLTKQPGWEERYEVTVYSLGWRLGGKAASSRNPDEGERIQEHGIHLFANFYFEMFAILKDCYAELYGPPEKPLPTTEPVTQLSSAFIGSNFQHCPSFYDGKWHTQVSWLPNNDGTPWDGHLPAPWTILREGVNLLYSIFTGQPPPSSGGSDNVPSGLFARLMHEVEAVAGELLDAALGKLLAEASTALHEVGEEVVNSVPKIVVEVFDAVLAFVRSELGKLATVTDRTRWIYVQVEFFATVLRGVVEDDLLNKDIDSIDGYSYVDWLKKHGATDVLLTSGMAQVVPNIGFNYPNGDSTKPAAFSAAPYVYFVLRQIVANGSALYFFAAGTGDTVIAPIYRVLEKRGVKFELVTKVKDIVPSKDGRHIERVDIEVQASPKKGNGPYRPLHWVKGMACWPDRPLYDQLEQGAELEAQNIDLESWWSPWKGKRRLLRRGKDFDFVVMAIPTGALPHIATKLIEQKKVWHDLNTFITAYPTQQVQLWLDKTVQELGWEYELPPGNKVVGATYNNPLVCYCDFTDLLKWEDWPKDRPPKSIIYFCGPMQAPSQWPAFSDHTFPAIQGERVKATAIQYLRTISGLLPNASSNPTDPQCLDFEVLHIKDEDENARLTGEQRFEKQFIKANIDPSERYVSSLPGTVQFRPKAWESGYENLAMAGDWIYTGMNIGSIECAVTGGALASHALTGSPTLAQISGYTFLHKGLQPVPKPLMENDEG